MYPMCASCGIEIRWQPTTLGGAQYCCIGCAEGGPCTCDYSQLPRREAHTAIVVHYEFREHVAIVRHREPRAESDAGSPGSHLAIHLSKE